MIQNQTHITDPYSYIQAWKELGKLVHELHNEIHVKLPLTCLTVFAVGTVVVTGAFIAAKKLLPLEKGASGWQQTAFKVARHIALGIGLLVGGVSINCLAMSIIYSLAGFFYGPMNGLAVGTVVAIPPFVGCAYLFQKAYKWAVNKQ